MGVILAPANGKGAASRLIKAGAREIYMGFHDEAWSRMFGNADLNRMSGFGEEANVLTFEELCEEIASVSAVQTADENRGTPKDTATSTADAHIAETAPSYQRVGVPGRRTAAAPIAEIAPSIFCTFNSTSYTSEQIAYISEHYLPALAQAGATGIIVSDPSVADAVRNFPLDIVASTICAVYNEDIARFYANRGVRRVILPRDMTLDEMAGIKNAAPELEYEIFLMRNGCVFSDSHCLGLHRANCPSLCRTLRESPWWEVPIEQEAQPDEEAVSRRIESSRLHKEIFHESTCGLCALWYLEHMGANAYKVVGRSDALDDLCRDVSLVHENLLIAQDCADEQEFLARMKRPDDILALCDNRGLSCYYPEVRFH